MTADTFNDEWLATRAAQGDRTAFGDLVRAYGPRLAALARSYGVPAYEIEDVVQDAFLAAFRGLGGYDSKRSFRAWLFQIALNKARDWRRRRSVRRFFFGAVGLEEPEAQAVEIDTPSPESNAHQQRLLKSVKTAVADLPEKLRQAFLLTTVGDLTYAEAAEALGITVKGVEGRVARARKQVQAQLSGLTAEV